MKSRFVALLGLLLSSCAGYHVGPIKPALLKDVHTLAVPAFRNETLEPRVEVMLASGVISQLQQDGTYRIASSDTADAVLKGTVLKISRRAQRAIRGNVLATSEFTVTVTVLYTITSRETKKLLDRRTVNGSTDFFLIGDVQQDERQALALAAADAARQIATQVSEGW